MTLQPITIGERTECAVKEALSFGFATLDYSKSIVRRCLGSLTTESSGDFARLVNILFRFTFQMTRTGLFRIKRGQFGKLRNSPFKGALSSLA
jgi:hypothetical protein